MGSRRALKAFCVLSVYLGGILIFVGGAAPVNAAPKPTDWVRTGDDSVIAAPLARYLPALRAATSPNGYSLTIDNSGLLDGNYPYTISIRSGSDYSPLRETLGAAAIELNRDDPTALVRAGTVDRADPVDREILVEVTDNLPSSCQGPTVVGCGGINSLYYGPGLKSNVLYIGSGHVWIPFRTFQQFFTPATFQQVVRHELGHALGLAHYDSIYDGQYQVMHSTITGTTYYQHGDQNGFGFLHGNGRSSPLGDVNDAQGAVRDSITVWGWALDPDAPTTETRVDMYVDGPAGVGREVFSQAATISRPDVAAAYPGVGNNHGFLTAIRDVSPGAHTLYVYAINIGAGRNVLIGSRNVTVPATPSGSPIGYFDGGAGAVTDSIWVWGWALDPDAPTTPSDVYVSVETSFGVWQGFNIGPANKSRPDVGAVFPGVGDNHGFTSNLKGIKPGTYAVAVYAINSGLGTNVLLGISNLVVPATAPGSPIGSFDSATAAPGGAVRVTGWTIDPNTLTTPTRVYVYVEGTVGVWQRFNIGPANKSRPDVGRANPGAGNNHGFSSVVRGISPGWHSVAAYAINTGAGTDVLLGSMSVNVPPA